MLDILGRVALVTGGSRGIGAAAALYLARAGADVVIIYSKHRANALDIERRIRNTGARAMGLRCRVEDYAQCKSVISKAIRRFGRVDILVNAAGIWEDGGVESMTPAEWGKTIGVNLTGTFNMCKLIVPIMKENHFGRIVNISSTAGQRGEAYHAHYAASKGGIIAFTKSIAVELIPYGIRVNCVAPGWVRTDMVAQVLRKEKEKLAILRGIPRGVFASPEDIAGPILFLTSGLAEHVIGEVLNVNGGSVLCG